MREHFLSLQRYRRAKLMKIRGIALFTVARSAMYAFNREKSVTQMVETYSEGFFPRSSPWPDGVKCIE
jgi:hypothetical protein